MTAPDFIAIAQNIPPEFYLTVLGGTGITLVVEKFKTWLEREQEKQAWVYLLISTTLAFLASLGQYVEAGGGQSWTVLGQHTATVLGAITLIYHFPKIGVKALRQVDKEVQAEAGTPAVALVPATVPATSPATAATILENEFGR